MVQVKEFWRRFTKNKTAVLGLSIMIFILLIVIFADVIVPYSKCIEQAGAERLQGPGPKHFFGTDEYGRDLFARVIHGSRFSLFIGVATSLMALVFGSLIGASAGYFGGMIDTHFTAANVDGAYVMAISVIGNGISVFDQILGQETQASDGVWLLRKNSNEVYHVIDDIEMDTLREKNKTFYAYRWLDKGSEVYLQTVTAANTKTVLDDGIEHDAMFFSYANNGHALTAVRYNVKDAKEKADPGTYKPALVKVRTDSSGNVTELEEVPKYDYGYYHVF